MKKRILLGLLILLLTSVTACGSAIQPQATEKTNSWTDNGVNAVYFPRESGADFVISLGEWQKENPNKEIVVTQSPLYEWRGSGIGGGIMLDGFTIFYRLK